MHVVLALYLMGVAVGLWRVDGGPMTKVALALLWPIGPAAGVLVIAGLLLVSLVAFPLVGAAVVSAAALAWWIL